LTGTVRLTAQTQPKAGFSDKWMMKPLHGQLLTQTREVDDSKSWAWLASDNLKKETEGFLVAA